LLARGRTIRGRPDFPIGLARKRGPKARRGRGMVESGNENGGGRKGESTVNWAKMRGGLGGGAS